MSQKRLFRPLMRAGNPLYRRHNLMALALLLALAYFPLFLNLDALAVRIFDESRLAINAYEMSRNGNLLVTHFRGEPEMWNTKPPLMIWLQAACIKLLGGGELAVRLPAALAALATLLLIFSFTTRLTGDPWWGMLCGLVLLTAAGYVGVHVSRTGDFDALLTLFTTAYCLSWYGFIERNDSRHLHLFFVTLTLAVLTKSVAALLFLPALFAYMLLRGRLSALRNRKLHIDLLISSAVIACYYLMRETFNPGYLKAVWENELGGRYLAVNEGHAQPFLFYWERLLTHQFSAWIWFALAGLLLLPFMRSGVVKNVSMLSALCAICFWLVISSAQTKLEWYTAPLFPFLAILATLPLYLLVKAASTSFEVTSMLRLQVLPLFVAICIFAGPYTTTVERVYAAEEAHWEIDDYSCCYLMQAALRGHRELHSHLVCVEGFTSHLEFYQLLLKERGIASGFADYRQLPPGSLVMTSQPHIKHYIERNYQAELQQEFHTAKMYRVGARVAAP